MEMHDADLSGAKMQHDYEVIRGGRRGATITTEESERASELGMEAKGGSSRGRH